MKKTVALLATLLLMFVAISSSSAASDTDELVPADRIVKQDDGKAVKPQSYRKAGAPGKVGKSKKAKKTGKKPVRKHK